MHPDDVKASLLLEIDRYLKAGRELFPLRPGAKEPLHRGWRDREYSRQQLRKYVQKRGCNIGWRLGPLDLVVDVDPRHDGATGAENKLTEKLEVPDLENLSPRVNSGGKDLGRHYYFRLPKKVKLKSKTPEYKGIDFLGPGRYVLIAGCLHPSGLQYEWDLFTTHEVPRAPALLLDALTYNTGPSAADPESASLTLPEIENYLSAIDPETRQDYDNWLQIGMSVHAASGGSFEAQELWVNWSISDPLYADAEDSARAKWLTFRTDHDSAITAATLIKAALDAGASPNATTPEQDFEDVPVEEVPKLTPLREWLTSLHDRETRPGLKGAIKQAYQYGEDNWDEIRAELKQAYKARLVTIDRLKKSFDAWRRRKKKEKQETDQTDPAILIADGLLAESFENGKHIVHAPNQVFYDYLGTHWAELKANVVKQLVLAKAEEVAADADVEAGFRPSMMFASVAQVLEAKTAKKHDVFGFTAAPPPVVNTQNCEIWIGEKGEIRPRPHRSTSYLLSCLEAKYDPHAECPLLDRTLLEIFQDNQDPEGMTRHFWEFTGYCIQPHKNIPVWAIWHGRGCNGKTLLKKLMMAILGSAVLPQPVADFADSARNNHAMASLVGKLLVVDDDARVDAFLPESALKKLAESNVFEANPKGKDPFNFRASATPLILINDWPRIRDLSWGMIRKAYVFPFKRVLTEAEQDLGLTERIIDTETSGVLNRALEGYQRLRARGHFDEPAECKAAKQEWLRAANPMIEFLATQVSKTKNGAFVPMDDLYQTYQVWCSDVGGVRYPLAQHRFEISMLQLGYQMGERKGSQAVLSVTVKGDFE